MTATRTVEMNVGMPGDREPAQPRTPGDESISNYTINCGP